MSKTERVLKKTITSEIINVSADTLWSIARRFDENALWTSVLKHSYGIDEPKHEGASCTTRTCETNFGKGKVSEEIIMFNDESKELSYNLIEGAPGFITLANNHWRVIEVKPGASKIEMKITLHMKRFIGFFLAGVITKQMTKQVKIVQAELKIYAETGEVSEAKKRQLEKRKPKSQY